MGKGMRHGLLECEASVRPAGVSEFWKGREFKLFLFFLPDSLAV